MCYLLPATSCLDSISSSLPREVTVTRFHTLYQGAYLHTLPNDRLQSLHLPEVSCTYCVYYLSCVYGMKSILM